ncbi:MAG: spore coat protein [Clostridia bacterium]|nr:spore coat protein [Clostridia bacterium]
MDYMKDITLNEKDSLQDMLNLEKNLVKVYSTVMTEGVSNGFRKTVKEHWNEAVDDQAEVYFMMTDKGYAEVESAPETTLSEERNKFAKVKSQLA